MATAAALDALDAAADEEWTPALTSLDATMQSLIFRGAETLTADELANLTYQSMMLEKPVLLSSGLYTETGASGAATDVTTVRLLGEPIAYGQVGGFPAATVPIVENGGGTGEFISLALVQEIGGEAVNTANAFLATVAHVQPAGDQQGRETSPWT